MLDHVSVEKRFTVVRNFPNVNKSILKTATFIPRRTGLVDLGIRIFSCVDTTSGKGLKKHGIGMLPIFQKERA